MNTVEADTFRQLIDLFAGSTLLLVLFGLFLDIFDTIQAKLLRDFFHSLIGNHRCTHILLFLVIKLGQISFFLILS
jgi:hypothetical protein